MVTIWCVKWGTEYSAEYVQILKAMVARNTTVEHRFICLSDEEISGVETILLPADNKLNGWWNKMYLFNYEFLSSQIEDLAIENVYFDLDTMITGNIDWLLKCQYLLMGIEDLGVNNKYELPERYIGTLQSGVLRWNSRFGQLIWNAFDRNRFDVLKNFRGDGEYLNHVINPGFKIFIQREFPNQLVSYKYQCYENGLPPGASIVCFHGQPRPHQAISETVHPWGTTYEPREWVAEYWKK